MPTTEGGMLTCVMGKGEWESSSRALSTFSSVDIWACWGCITGWEREVWAETFSGVTGGVLRTGEFPGGTAFLKDSSHLWTLDIARLSCDDVKDGCSTFSSADVGACWGCMTGWEREVWERTFSGDMGGALRTEEFPGSTTFLMVSSHSWTLDIERLSSDDVKDCSRFL